MDAAEFFRYQRQTILPGFGQAGQQKLKETSVLVVGLGGLGCPLALYLAAAGIGRLGLVDGDRVEESNLHRQIIYTTEDIGKPKAMSAAAHLRRINPYLEAEEFPVFLGPDNAQSLASDFQILADGTDQLSARYILNRLCVSLSRPAVFAAVEQWEGTLFWYEPGGPCYSCVYPESNVTPLACAEAGVLGTVPGLLGILQAQLILSSVLGRSKTQFTMVDLNSFSMRTMELDRNPDCPVCGQKEKSAARKALTPKLVPEALMDSITPRELKVLLAEAGEAPLLLDVRERYETEISRIEGSLLIPVSEFVERLSELEPERFMVVYCKVGIRSAQVVEYLRNKGFKRVLNLAGGINAWADQVDPEMATY